MDKLLITLEVPSVSESFDVFIPNFLRIGLLVPLLAEAVSELTQNRYVSSRQEFLCSKEKAVILKEEGTLRDYGIQNGDHLMLY